MPSIDERVVQMQFDNKQFEHGIRETSQSLDKFKKQLDFDKTSRSFDKFSDGITSFGKKGIFDKIGESVKNFKNAFSSLKKHAGDLGDFGSSGLSGFNNGLKNIAEQISNLNSLGTMAFNRVKKAILDAAESAISFGKSLSVDQISAGLDKYEKKISSIKTISNATGLGAEAVNNQLDRLNWFTDETSASFSSMVENIGKFTSVGRGLSESITAMQGIATWGYHSGADVAAQTRAMYNLSQALGTGSVKLIDWKSIENAGMATKEFKEQAIAAAEASGKLKRKGDKLFTATGKGKAEEVTAANFNSTLAKGWFTSDVLMDVLTEYGEFANKVREYQEKHPEYGLATDAMKAMDAERLAEETKIYEENLDKWTKASGKSSDAIKADVKAINKITNTKEREKEIKKFASTVGISAEEATKILNKLADCEESIGEKAFKSSQQAKTFKEALEATKDAVSTQWMNSFQIIFGGLDDSIRLWSDVTEVLWDLFASGGKARNNILKQWASMGGRETLFGRLAEDGTITGGVLHNVADTLLTIKDTISSSVKDVLFPGVEEKLNSIITTSDRVRRAQEGLFTDDEIRSANISSYYGYQLKEVTASFEKFTEGIKDFFTNEDNIENMGKAFSGIFSAIVGIGKLIGSLAGGIGDFLKESGAAGKVLEIFGEVGERMRLFFGDLEYNGVFKKFREEVSSTLMGFDGLLDNIDLSVITTALNTVFSILKGGWRFIKSILNGISSFLQNSGFINKTLKLVNNVLGRISTFIEAIAKDSNLSAVTETITTMLTDAYSLLDDIDLGFVTEALDGVYSIVLGIARFIKPIVSGLANGLKKSGALKSITKIITRISRSVTTLFHLININGDYKRFQEGIEEIATDLGKLFDNLDLSGLDSLLTGAWGIISNAWEGIRTILDAALEFLDAFGIPQALLDALGTLGDVFTWLSDKMKEFHVWDDVRAGLSSGIAKIKEVFVHFKDEIGRFLEDSGIAAKFREWRDKLKEWLFPSSLDKNGELTGLAKIFQNVRNSFNSGIESLKNAKVYDWLMEKWNQLKDSGIIDGLKKFWEALKSIFGGGKAGEEVNEQVEEVSDVVETQGNFITKIIDTIKGFFEKIKNLLGLGKSAEEGTEAVEAQGSFFDKLKEIFSNLDLGTVIGALVGLGGLVTAFTVLFKITGLFKKVTGAVEGAGRLINGARNLVSGVGNFLNNINNTLRSFSSSLRQKTKITQIGAMVLMIAGAIWLIADVVSKLGQMSPEQLAIGGAAMIVCAGVLVGVVAIMKQLSKNKMALGIKDLIGLIIMTMMIGKLAETVVKLGSLKPEQAITGVLSLGAILGIIFGFMKLLSTFKSNIAVDMGFMFMIGDVLLKMSDVVIKLGALPVDQLAKGLVALGAIMLMLGLFMRSTSQLVNKNYYKANNSAGFMKLIGTAITILVLAHVLIILSYMSWEQIAKGVVAMTGVMGLLALFMRITNEKVDKKNPKKNTAGFIKMIGIALTMVILAKALMRLSTLSWEQIGKGLTAMAGIMLIVGIFMKSTTVTFNKNYYSNKNQAGFLKLIGIALTMVILVRAFKELAMLDINQIGRGLAAMAGMMLILGVFIKAMMHTFENVSDRFSRKNDAGVFKLIGIAFTMLILGKVFKDLAELEWDQIGRGLAAMAGVMLILGVFVKAMMRTFDASLKGIGNRVLMKNEAGFFKLIGIALTLVIVAHAFKGLAELEWSGIIKGIIGLGAIMLMLSLMIKSSHISVAESAKMAMTFGVMIGMGFAITLFALSLKTISTLPLEGILKGVIGLTGILLAIAVFMKVTNHITTGGGIIKGLLVLIPIAIGMGLFVLALHLVKDIDPSVIAAFGATLGIIVTAIGDITETLTKNSFKTGALLKSALGMAASMGIIMLVTMGAFALCLQFVKDIDPAVIGVFGAALTTITAAMQSVMETLSSTAALPATLMIKSALGLAAGLGIIVLAMMALVAGFGALYNAYPPFKAALEGGVEVFTLIGKAFGSLIGGVIGGILGGLAFDVPDFGAGVASLGEGIKAFSDSIKGIGKIDKRDREAAINSLLALVAISWLLPRKGGLLQLIYGQGDLSDFAKGIGDLGKGLKSFVSGIRGLSKMASPEDMKSAMKTAMDLAIFTKFVTDPGSLGDILRAGMAKMFGVNTSFESFVSQMQPFGKALNAYTRSIRGISRMTEDSSNAIAIAEDILKFKNRVEDPGSVGQILINWFAKITGTENTFDHFIDLIDPFGQALKKYSNSISGFSKRVSEEDTAAAIGAANSIKGFYDTFGSDTLQEAVINVMDQMFGGGGEASQFNNFITQIVPFGEALKAYAGAISGFSTTLSQEDQDAAIAAATGIQSIYKHFGSDSIKEAVINVIDKMFGSGGEETQFGIFISQIAPFGAALKAYAESISGFSKTLSQEDQDAAIAAARGIKGFYDEFGSDNLKEAVINAIDNMFGGGSESAQFTTFVSQIGPFGTALKTYSDSISGFSTTLSKEDQDAAIAAAKGIKGFYDSFGSDGLKEAVLDVIDKMFGSGSKSTQFTKFIEQIVPFGTALKSYSSSISGFSTTVSSSDTDAAIEAAKGIKKFAESFGSEGIGEALLSGIDNLFGGGTEITKFTQFNAQMPVFGEGLKAYASGISEIAVITDEDRESALAAAKGLKDFADSFNKVGDSNGKGTFAYIADSVCGLFSGGTNSMEEFKTFSEGMISFGQGLSNYAEGVKDIVVLEDGQTDTAIQTVEAIKKFAESLVVDSSNKTWFDRLTEFTSIFGGNKSEAGTASSELGTFGESMQALGDGIKKFATAAGKVKTETTDNAIAAINSVAELANSELLEETGMNNNGLWSKLNNFFNGNKVEMLTNFADQMQKFGEAISGFATSLQDYPTDDLPIEKAVKAVKDYAKATKTLTDDDSLVEALGYNGTLIDFFEGGITNSDEAQKRWDAMSKMINSMGSFGQNISSFATAVKDYKSPSQTTWDQLKQTVGDMAGFASELATSGYTVNSYSLSSFAADLKDFAPDFNEFVKRLKGTSKTLEDDQVNGLETLTDNQLNTFNVIITAFTNVHQALASLKDEHKGWLKAEDFYSLSYFGNGIQSVGTGLKEVFDSLSLITDTDISEGGKIDSLVNVVSRFKDVAVSLGNMPDGGKGYNLGNLGDNVRTFFDRMVGVQWDKIDATKLANASSAATMLAYAAARLKEAAVSSEDLGTLSSVLEVMLGLGNTGDDQGSGETLANNFVTNFCTELSNKVTAETASTGSIYINGYNVTMGFANGMFDNAAMLAVANNAAAVVKKAIDTMQSAADEHSPSKITTQIGQFMSKGLANGIGNEDQSIVSEATSAVGLALSAFSTAMDNDLDNSPVITPVVDLSNVEEGANAAGSLFGGRYSLDAGISSRLAGRAAGSGERQNNTTNVTVDTSNIATTIDAVNAHIDSLMSQVMNLKVVMNNGALVGQIAPEMDRALGRMANRNAIS